MYDGRKILKITGVVLGIIIIIGYTIYQTYNFAEGPILSISYPTSGMTFEKSLVEIKGIVKNASYITLNDNQIFVDEKGNFKEKLLLSQGYNIFEIEVKDKFDRVKREKLELVYIPNNF